MNTILRNLAFPYINDSLIILNKTGRDEYVKTFVLRPIINTDIDRDSIKNVFETTLGIGTLPYQKRIYYQFNDGNFQVLYIIHFSKLFIGTQQLENLQNAIQNWGYYDLSICDEYAQPINYYRLFYDKNISDILKQDMNEKSEPEKKIIRRRDGSIAISQDFTSYVETKMQKSRRRTRSCSTQTYHESDFESETKPDQEQKLEKLQKYNDERLEQKMAEMEAKMKKMDDQIDSLTWFRKGFYERLKEVRRDINKLNGYEYDE